MDPMYDFFDQVVIRAGSKQFAKVFSRPTIAKVLDIQRLPENSKAPFGYLLQYLDGGYLSKIFLDESCLAKLDTFPEAANDRIPLPHMMASVLVEKLNALIAKHGDLPVEFCDSEYTHYDFDVVFADHSNGLKWEGEPAMIRLDCC